MSPALARELGIEVPAEPSAISGMFASVGKMFSSAVSTSAAEPVAVKVNAIGIGCKTENGVKRCRVGTD